MHRKTSLILLVLVLALLVTIGNATAQGPAPQRVSAPLAPLTSAFTYQGYLVDVGLPANGNYDIQFKLFDAVSGGNQVGSTINKDDLLVTDGLFMVDLNFGAT